MNREEKDRIENAYIAIRRAFLMHANAEIYDDGEPIVTVTDFRDEFRAWLKKYFPKAV